jgi:hypothetical protein
MFDEYATEQPPAAGSITWKIAAGVCIGILLAAGILAIGYQATVKIPQQAAQQKAADVARHAQLDAAIADLDQSNAARQAEILQAEKRIKKMDPSSPCNVLTGEPFTECSARSGHAAQRKFVALQREPASVVVQ